VVLFYCKGLKNDHLDDGHFNVLDCTILKAN